MIENPFILSKENGNMFYKSSIIVSLLLLTLSLFGENWPQAAGPNNNFQVKGSAPKDFSVSLDKNVVWRTPLPNTGQGTPIVSNGKVFVTSHEEIDQINILNASILAMHRALEQLKHDPEYIMVDGNRFKPFGAIPYETLVKGDGKLQNIAAASILAKTHRDDIMTKLHEEFPVFNWKQNMGYPTPEHRTAVGEHGRSPFHRKSFKIKDPQLSLWS